MHRFSHIHTQLASHHLWNMCAWYDIDAPPVQAQVKLGKLPLKPGQCLFGDCKSGDIVNHQLLCCENLTEHNFENVIRELLLIT